MKTFRFILVVMLLTPLLASAEITDGVKAVVNQRAITFAEVEDFSRPAVDALRRQYLGQPDVFQQKVNETLGDSLEQLVERQIILHSFDVEGYKLPDSVVDQMVHDRIHERFGDRLTLMKTLQAQGMTLEQFRKQVREQYIESALRNQNVQREIIISPYKVQSYYEANQGRFMLEDQVKLRMIVLTKTSANDRNTVKLAEEIKGKIKEGATFNEMAAVYSQGSQQRQGGDWGWVERSVLRKELAEAAFKLGNGQVSDPIETSDTIYLMLVEDKRTTHAKPLGEVREEIEKSLRTQQQAQLQKQWIDGLKKKTFIRYF